MTAEAITEFMIGFPIGFLLGLILWYIENDQT